MPPLLPTAFLASNQSAVNLFSKLQKGGIKLQGGQTYTTEQFVKEWPAGGKKFLETHWRDPANTPVHATSQEDRSALAADGFDDEGVDDLNRELYQGKHEWIPTNYLGYVVEWGISCHNDIRWIYFAEVLRIPTRLVVIHPRKVRESAGKDDPLGLHGHIGALYLKGSAKGGYGQRIKSQSVFHDELRELVKACLSVTTNDPVKYSHGLDDHIADWYWTGDLASAATACGMSAMDFARLPCPYYYNSGRSEYESWGPTMGDMAKGLTEGWAMWRRINQTQFAAGLTLSPR